MKHRGHIDKKSTRARTKDGPYVIGEFIWNNGTFQLSMVGKYGYQRWNVQTGAYTLGTPDPHARESDADKAMHWNTRQAAHQYLRNSYALPERLQVINLASLGYIRPDLR